MKPKRLTLAALLLMSFKTLSLEYCHPIASNQEKARNIALLTAISKVTGHLAKNKIFSFSSVRNEHYSSSLTRDSTATATWRISDEGVKVLKKESHYCVVISINQARHQSIVGEPDF